MIDVWTDDKQHLLHRLYVSTTFSWQFASFVLGCFWSATTWLHFIPQILQQCHLCIVFNPNLGGVGWGNFMLLCWFSLNNSGTMKAVTLAFCSIQLRFIKIFVPNLVSLTCPGLQILDKTQMVVFLMSVVFLKSLIKENCHSCRTSNDIDVKLRPATQLDKRKKFSLIVPFILQKLKRQLKNIWKNVFFSKKWWQQIKIRRSWC